jgi:hypothetical protein
VNGRLQRACVLCALLALFAPASAQAETAVVPSAQAGPGQTPSRYGFELGAFLTATWLPKGLAVDAGIESDRNIGFGGALSLAYRGPFFLYPFLDIGYFNLAQSTIHPVTRLGGVSADSVENTLNAWTYTFGPGLDVGPMRFRLGVGLNTLLTSMQGKDFDDDATALGFLTGLSVSGAVLRSGAFRLNIEGRTTYFVYAATVMLALGVSGSFDVLSW